MLWSHDGGLPALADRSGGPTGRTWSASGATRPSAPGPTPTEAADYPPGRLHGRRGGLGRPGPARGLPLSRSTWGEGPAGTVGGEDIFQIPEVINGSPHVYALSRTPPRCSTGGVPARAGGRGGTRPRGQRAAPSPGWDPAHGRLVIDTPFTQALAGWVGRAPARLDHLEFSTENEFAVLAATSLGPEPIAEAKRLLVTAIGRVEPTGFRWVDSWKRAVADPGRPPFLQEPVRARVVWRRKGTFGPSP